LLLHQIIFGYTRRTVHEALAYWFHQASAQFTATVGSQVEFDHSPGFSARRMKCHAVNIYRTAFLLSQCRQHQYRRIKTLDKIRPAFFQRIIDG
jgi:hypothetical protein